MLPEIGGDWYASVDYGPWPASGTDINGDPGFQGDFSVLWVSAACPQVNSVERVQETVKMVTGSMINLSPGTYTGQVKLMGFSNPNLVGSGISTTTIKAPPRAMPYHFLRFLDPTITTRFYSATIPRFTSRT